MTYCVMLTGNQERDGHPGTRSGTLAPVVGTRKDRSACAFERSEDEGHRVGPCFYRQRPVYVQTVSSENPDR